LIGKTAPAARLGRLHLFITAARQAGAAAAIAALMPVW